MQMADGGAVIARMDGCPVGAALFRLRSDHLYIGRLSVLPQHRSRGIASALLQLITQIAELAGRKELRLGTRLSLERNIALYRKHGYEISEYLHPASQFADTVVIMTRRLD